MIDIVQGMHRLLSYAGYVGLADRTLRLPIATLHNYDGTWNSP